MIIYVTPLNPETRAPLADSKDSGFTSISDVVAVMGKPLAQGVRTATYKDYFYSDYNFTEFPATK